mmetsp:Transcript_169789/g.412731  ORF Transcript_169789/g.412731 Transcript_169789/m.412731 type:complete len:93 (-) Transcript_169789:37-315(-)
MVLKVGIVALGLLSLSGVLPVALLMLCPASYRQPQEVLLMNVGGLSQRCIVACIALYLASYSVDLGVVRRQLVEQEARELHERLQEMSATLP